MERIKKFASVCVVSWIAFHSLEGQEFQRRVDLPLVQGWENPSLGGSAVPKASLVDMDMDGDLDAVIAQNDGRVTFFLNSGTPASAQFQWITDFFDSLHVGPWATWKDMDGDGDPDLFAGRNNSTVAYYENVGMHFVLRQDPVVDSVGNAVLSEVQSIPVLVDIDGDGDHDFFTGRSTGTLAFYRNVGTSASPLFKFITENFEGISIITPARTRKSSLHGASSIDFADVDSDGDFDLFWGDFFSTSIYFLENEGTPTAPSFPSVTESRYPSAQMATRGFNRPFLADIDADGDPDLFVTVLTREEDLDNFWYFRNDGSPVSPSFTLVTRNFLPQLDIGRQAHPAWIDIDADGDRDLFLGSYSGRIYFYRNLNSDSIRLLPDTTVKVPVPADIFITSPAFFDADADGDQDILCGNFNGRMLLFRNVGTPTVPSFVLESSQWENIDVGNHSSPSFVDIDGDGDRDLIIGAESGILSLLYNQSGNTSFVPGNFITPYMQVGAADVVPEWNDFDRDGDMDLFVGLRDGTIRWYENVGTSTGAIWRLTDSLFLGMKTTAQSVPRFVDGDGDGDDELMVGSQRGGVEWYEHVDAAPRWLSLTPPTAFVGKTFLWIPAAVGNPRPRFRLLTAPAEVQLDTMTGQINWIPAEPGDFVIEIRAHNLAGSSDVSLPVHVSPSQKPAISTHLFQNPAIESRLDVVVTSDEELVAPPTVRWWLGSDTSTVVMTPVSDGRVFRGSVSFSEGGTYGLQTAAVGIGGMDSVQTRSWVATFANRNESVALMTSDGRIRLTSTPDHATVFLTYDEANRIDFRLPSRIEFVTTTESAQSIRRWYGDAVETLPASWDPAKGTWSATFQSGGYFSLEKSVGQPRFVLFPNYPNPFNPGTSIRFEIPSDSRIRLSIFNLLGQEIRVLATGDFPAGRYEFHWDGKDSRGRPASSGVYVYRLQTPSRTASGKMLRLK